jgi:hypothetical protein
MYPSKERQEGESKQQFPKSLSRDTRDAFAAPYSDACPVRQAELYGVWHSRDKSLFLPLDTNEIGVKYEQREGCGPWDRLAIKRHTLTTETSNSVLNYTNHQFQDAGDRAPIWFFPGSLSAAKSEYLIVLNSRYKKGRPPSSRRESSKQGRFRGAGALARLQACSWHT